MRFTLEKYNGSKSRFTCPNCQKKKQFTRYIDNSTREYINESVGICNRKEKCGYHLTPSEYFENNSITPQTTQQDYTPPPPEPIEYLPYDYVIGSLKKHEENNFVQFLISKTDEQSVNRIIDEYKLGTSKHWKGATVFWQIDEQNRVRTGKVMLYCNQGKRVKIPYSHINWVHKILKLEYNYEQCFFGSHLLRKHPSKIVGIVESEKTALICSVYYPDMIWLATGSLQMLSAKRCHSLINRKVVLFPDVSENGTAFIEWSKKASMMRSMNIEATVNELLHNKATKQDKKAGLDIADYLLSHNYQDFRSTQQIQTPQDIALEKMIERHPIIEELVNKFNLIPERTT